MTGAAKAQTGETPAARQRRVWDKSAPGYDKQIAFFEKSWFGGGRDWLGQRAHGRVLEVAIGTTATATSVSQARPTTNGRIGGPSWLI